MTLPKSKPLAFAASVLVGTLTHSVDAAATCRHPADPFCSANALVRVADPQDPATVIVEELFGFDDCPLEPGDSVRVSIQNGEDANGATLETDASLPDAGRLLVLLTDCDTIGGEYAVEIGDDFVPQTVGANGATQGETASVDAVLEAKRGNDCISELGASEYDDWECNDVVQNAGSCATAPSPLPAMGVLLLGALVLQRRRRR